MKILSLIFAACIFAVIPVESKSACKTLYPFLTNIKSPPRTTRLNIDLFSQIYSQILKESTTEIKCPVQNVEWMTCHTAYEFRDGSIIMTGYSDNGIEEEVDDRAITLSVHGLEAKLAPITTETTMIDIGYRQPGTPGIVILAAIIPRHENIDHSEIAPIYPLLMRVFEAEVCRDE